MPIDYDTVLKGDVLWVTALGETMSVDVLVEYVRAMTQDALDMGVKKVLVDNRRIIGAMDVLQSHDFAVDVEEQIELAKTIRWAVVTSPERMKALRFFETVARNRGLSILAFDTIEEAEDWLAV